MFFLSRFNFVLALADRESVANASPIACESRKKEKAGQIIFLDIKASFTCVLFRALCLVKSLVCIDRVGLVREQHIVEYCCENGLPVQGRGSAANSAVCYLLGITAVDRSAWICCSNAFFEKYGASGRTSISIFRPEMTVNEPSSMSTNATANLARRCAPTSSPIAASLLRVKQAKHSALTSTLPSGSSSSSAPGSGRAVPTRSKSSSRMRAL